MAFDDEVASYLQGYAFPQQGGVNPAQAQVPQPAGMFDTSGQPRAIGEKVKAPDGVIYQLGGDGKWSPFGVEPTPEPQPSTIGVTAPFPEAPWLQTRPGAIVPDAGAAIYGAARDTVAGLGSLPGDIVGEIRKLMLQPGETPGSPTWAEQGGDYLRRAFPPVSTGSMPTDIASSVLRFGIPGVAASVGAGNVLAEAPAMARYGGQLLSAILPDMAVSRPDSDATLGDLLGGGPTQTQPTDTPMQKRVKIGAESGAASVAFDALARLVGRLFGTAQPPRPPEAGEPPAGALPPPGGQGGPGGAGPRDYGYGFTEPPPNMPKDNTQAAWDAYDTAYAAWEQRRNDFRRGGQQQQQGGGSARPSGSPNRSAPFDEAARAFRVSPEGFVLSETGDPIVFGTAKQAATWTQWANRTFQTDQILEPANHPTAFRKSAGGGQEGLFTVRMTGTREADAGPARPREQQSATGGMGTAEDAYRAAHGGTPPPPPPQQPKPQPGRAVHPMEGVLRQAAEKHGVDPDTMVTIGKLESGLDPTKVNPKSQASGLGQFMPQTWARYGRGRDVFDPAANADATAELAADNQKTIEKRLGRPLNPWEQYLAHQQGAGGALALLRSPDRPAVDVVGRNEVLDNGGKEDMTAGEFAGMWKKKFEAAHQGETADLFEAPARQAGVSPERQDAVDLLTELRADRRNRILNSGAEPRVGTDVDRVVDNEVALYLDKRRDLYEDDSPQGRTLIEAQRLLDEEEAARATRAQQYRQSQGSRGGGSRVPDEEKGRRQEVLAGEAPVVQRSAGASTPHERLADWFDRTAAEKSPPTWRTLEKASEESFGSPITSGRWNAQDRANATEFAVNRAVERQMPPASELPDIKDRIARAKAIEDRMPTQTVRAGAKTSMQQFSTPPHYGEAVAWLANIKPTDVVLEPSAGTGSLAVPARQYRPAQIAVNELDPRRAGMLRDLGFDRATELDAEHIEKHPTLHSLKPTVVVMNPPFSSAGNRGIKSSTIGPNHVMAALQKLQPGGRLVAIVGGGLRGDAGMSPETKAYRPWFDRVGKQYDIKANVRVAGKVYARQGTSFATRVLVIDKTPPSGRPPIMGEVGDVAELTDLLKGVRDERPSMGPAGKPETAAVGGEPGAERTSAGATRPTAPERDIAGHEPGAPERPQRGAGRAGGSGQRGGSAEPHPGRERGTAVDAGRRAEDDVAGTGEGAAGKPRLDAGDAERPVAAEPAGVDPATTVSEAGRQSETPPDISETRIFDPYKPAPILKGAQGHPTALVESSAMASVPAPEVTYRPRLAASAIESGALSDAQVEAIARAGAAHSRFLPDADGNPTQTRQGIMIGDGTGVGKSREIAGIIYDALARAPTMKALWVSKDRRLFGDAQMNFTAIGGDAKTMVDHGSFAPAADIDKGRILFSTYTTLANGAQFTPAGGISRRGSRQSRIEQASKWLGNDFDGVIIFDEAHVMANAIGGRGSDASQVAMMGLALQRMFPKARVVYATATGATEVSNLAYAERLGLWGPGAAFADRNEFLNEIAGRGSLSDMELVARDLKQRGLYTARTLSFGGSGPGDPPVEFERVVVSLSEGDRELYARTAEAWRGILDSWESALNDSGASKNKLAKAYAQSRLWSFQQRFFQHLLTSAMLPRMMKMIEADLKEGRSAVIQLTRTNEAAQKRAMAAAMDDGGEVDIETLDVSPKQALLDLVRDAYPVQVYEEVVDENGNVRHVPAMTKDKNGRDVPLEDPELVRRRDSLISQLEDYSFPQGAIDTIIDRFGTDKVAEVTGRSKRVVMHEGRRRIESRTSAGTKADIKAFNDGKKRILIFSEAGGTGASYHSDKTFKNQEPRRHYLLEAGWSAPKAIQGLGRTHRANQAHPPRYILLSTDIAGHKRFVSTIAKRIEQLGALTRGQREAASGGIFDAGDNLEDIYADTAVQWLVHEAGRSGSALSRDVLQKEMGLWDLYDRAGNVVRDKVPSVQRFLNRLLALDPDKQNEYFEAFSRARDQAIAHAVETGQFDRGLETIKTLTAKADADHLLHTDKVSGAETRLMTINATVPAKKVAFAQVRNAKHGFVEDVERGEIYALMNRRTQTTQAGSDEFYDLRGVQRDRQISTRSIANPLRYRFLDAEAAAERWAAEMAATPAGRPERYNVVTGAILPVWNRIPRGGSIVRLRTDDGSIVLGKRIAEDDVGRLMTQFGINSDFSKFEPGDVVEALNRRAVIKTAADEGFGLKMVYARGYRVIEVSGMGGQHQKLADRLGLVRLDQKRGSFFVPSDRSGRPDEAVLQRLMKEWGIRSIDYPGSGDDGGPPRGGSSGPTFSSNPFLNPALIRQIGPELISGLVSGMYGNWLETGTFGFSPRWALLGSAAMSAALRAPILGRPLLGPGGHASKFLRETVPDALAKTKVGRLFHPTSGIARDLFDRVQGMKGDIDQMRGDVVAQADAVRRAFTPAERAVMSDWIEDIDWNASSAAATSPQTRARAGLAGIDQRVRDQADAFARDLEGLGAEAVRLGMMNQETYDKRAGEYLPRYYAKWESAKQRLKGGGARPTIEGRWAKMRGLAQPMPEAFAKAGWKKGDAVFNMTRPDGKIAYIRPNQRAAYEAQGYITGHRWEVMGENVGGKTMLWRDWTPYERRLYGEIRDANYRYTKGRMALERDVILGQLYERLSQDPKWASTTQQAPDWIKVPRTGANEVPQSMRGILGNEPRLYGKLAGMWVHPEAWRALELAGPGTAYDRFMASKMMKAYRTVLSAWKVGKTVINPVSWTNNFASNVSLALMHGDDITPASILRAELDLRRNAPIVEQARKAGLAIGHATKLGDTLTYMERELGIMRQRPGLPGHWARLLSFYFNNMATRGYGEIDRLFKMASFSEAVKRGKPAEEAARAANDMYFDFGHVPQAVKAMRDWHSPFFTYSYHVLRAMPKLWAEKPHRMLAAFGALSALGIYAYDSLYGDNAGGQEALEREYMPQWLKGITAIGTPAAVRLPGNLTDKETGEQRPTMLNTRYWLPGGDLFDLANNAKGSFGPEWWPAIFGQTPLGGNPIINTFYALNTGLDPFFGKPIFPYPDGSLFDRESPGWQDLKNAEALAKWLSYQWGPPIGTWTLDKVGNAAVGEGMLGEDSPLAQFMGWTGVDYAGRQRGMMKALLSSIGVKVEDFSVEDALKFERYADQKRIRDARAASRRAQRNQSVTETEADEKKRAVSDARERRARTTEKRGILLEGAGQ